MNLKMHEIPTHFQLYRALEKAFRDQGKGILLEMSSLSNTEIGPTFEHESGVSLTLTAIAGALRLRVLVEIDYTPPEYNDADEERESSPAEISLHLWATAPPGPAPNGMGSPYFSKEWTDYCPPLRDLAALCIPEISKRALEAVGQRQWVRFPVRTVFSLASDVPASYDEVFGGIYTRSLCWSSSDRYSREALVLPEEIPMIKARIVAVEDKIAAANGLIIVRDEPTSEGT
jgi:hypothetical protein